MNYYKPENSSLSDHPTITIVSEAEGYSYYKANAPWTVVSNKTRMAYGENGWLEFEIEIKENNLFNGKTLSFDWNE